MNVAENLAKLFSLEGKVIILTGATGGIGEALAMGLARAGGNMVLTGTREGKLQEVVAAIQAEGGQAAGFVLDMTKVADMKPFVDMIMGKYGKIDVLINNAGVNKRDGFLDYTEEDYDRIMTINLKSLYFLSQEAARNMMKVHNGNIINIASHNSVGMLGGCSVYGASKSALAALTRSMAVEWSQYGIRANAVAPGHILTPLTEVNWRTSRADYLRPRIAMERPAQPEELLGTIIMLASDSSSYITGTMIHVDGGVLAGGTPWHYDTQYDSKY